jgi:hypothetical protein
VSRCSFWWAQRTRTLLRWAYILTKEVYQLVKKKKKKKGPQRPAATLHLLPVIMSESDPICGVCRFRRSEPPGWYLTSEVCRSCLGVGTKVCWCVEWIGWEEEDLPVYPCRKQHLPDYRLICRPCNGAGIIYRRRRCNNPHGQVRGSSFNYM